jgi:hypothetical protein
MPRPTPPGSCLAPSREDGLDVGAHFLAHSEHLAGAIEFIDAEALPIQRVLESLDGDVEPDRSFGRNRTGRWVSGASDFMS